MRLRLNRTRFIPTWRTWGTWSFQGEKVISPRLSGRRSFLRKFQRKTWCYQGDFFFTSVFVLCHSETLRDWSLNAFYMYLAPLLLYGNLNYSVSMFLYFSIWFLIKKNFEIIWCFGFCFFFTILDSTLSNYMKAKVSVLQYFSIGIIHWPTSKLRSKLSVFFFKFRLKSNNLAKQSLINWLRPDLFPQFSSWVEEIKGLPHQYRCNACCCVYEMSNMGQKALTSHMTK